MLDKLFILMCGREDRPRTKEQIEIFLGAMALTGGGLGFFYGYFKLIATFGQW